MSDKAVEQGVAYKVFHFGIQWNLTGQWLKHHKPPGFHCWREKVSAYKYMEGLKGAEIKEVLYKGVLETKQEPEGEAILVDQIFVI